MKSFLKNFLLVVFTTWISIEGLSYIIPIPYYPTPPSSDVITMTSYFTESKNYREKTNNYGFRNNQDFHFPMKKNYPHILLIGDSMIYGLGSTLSIEAYLSKMKPNYRIFNGGVVGANPKGYFQVLEAYFDKLKPDYVFIGLFPGNDFTGPFEDQKKSIKYKGKQILKKIFPNLYLFYQKLKRKNGTKIGRQELQPVSTQEYKKGAIERVQSLNHIYSLNVKIHILNAENYDYENVLNKYPELKYLEYVNVIANAIFFKNHMKEAIELKTPNSLENYEQSFATVQEMKEFIEKKNKKIQIVYLLFPLSFMFDEKYATFYKDLGYNLPKFQKDFPLYKKIKMDLAGISAQVIDLNEMLKNPNIFFTEDWHMNELGNQLTAKIISNWIDRNKNGN